MASLTNSTHENDPSNMNESSGFVSPRTNACRDHYEIQNLCTDERKPKHVDSLDLLMTFVSSLMERDYGTSLQLCKQVIDHEPENEIALQFFPLLLRKNTEDYEKKRRNSSSESSGESSTGSSSSEDSSDESNDSSSSSSSDDPSGSEDSESSESDESEPDSDNLETMGLPPARFNRSNPGKI